MGVRPRRPREMRGEDSERLIANFDRGLPSFERSLSGVGQRTTNDRRASESRAVFVKVFLAGTSLLPTYGGPALSVSRLAMALEETGIEVGLWASDQSAASTPLLPRKSSMRRIVGTEAAALNSFGKTDILHDNGIWLPHNHRLARLAAAQGIPRVVSTRGMLEPWALNHKRWKKAIAWSLYQRRDLKRAEAGAR